MPSSVDNLRTAQAIVAELLRGAIVAEKLICPVISSLLCDGHTTWHI